MSELSYDVFTVAKDGKTTLREKIRASSWEEAHERAKDKYRNEIFFVQLGPLLYLSPETAAHRERSITAPPKPTSSVLRVKSRSK
jgi:hypothetical protein